MVLDDAGVNERPVYIAGITFGGMMPTTDHMALSRENATECSLYSVGYPICV